MKIAKKKVWMQIPLANPMIDRERQLEKILKKGQNISICYNTPDDNHSGSYKINLPYYGGWSPEEWLVNKNKVFMALNGQGIRYTLTERLLSGEARLSLRTVDNLNKLLAEMITHPFSACSFREQKKYLCRNLGAWNYVVSLAGLKKWTPVEISILLIQKAKKLHLYLQMKSWTSSDISWLSRGKNKMIEQGSNYTDSIVKEITEFFWN